MVFSIFRVVLPSPQSILEHLHYAKATLSPLAISHSSQSPQSNDMLFLYVSVYVWYFVHGTIQHITFWDWLSLLSQKFSKPSIL